MTEKANKPVPIRLVSACMAGFPCRYNGKAKPVEAIEEMVIHGEAMFTCPEMLAGFDTPRRPAEIVGGDGDDVLDGTARIVDASGLDVTEAFVKGAYQTLHIAQAAKVQEAILKEGSPSCGCTYIYDGSFSGTQRTGMGVTAALLHRNTISVISEAEMLKRDAMEQSSSIMETLEVMSDTALMIAFRQGVQELNEGKGRPWKDVKKDLGL